MNNFKQTSGIKRAHNGAIGESRTKSFLIDRFWILERSVDIEGADFIIQRKLEGRSILDNNPPRFGIIQSKFSQDESTQHRLKQEYVIDNTGKPHMEFFLIVHIAYEDAQKICLLPAKDIVDNFKPDSHNQYLIPTKKLIPKFLINNKKSSLDYIEKSIQCVDFYKNRMYVFNELSSDKPDLSAIHPDYCRDVVYRDGNIPDLFKKQKIEAYEFMLHIEKLHEHLLKFVREIDPVQSCYIAELFNHHYRGAINIPQIFDKEFYYKTQRYLEQINCLKEDGVLENYFSFKEIIKNKVDSFLISLNSTFDLASQHIISIKYCPINLNDIVIENNITSLKSPSNGKYYNFLKLKEGEIVMAVKIGWHLKNNGIIPPISVCCLIDIMEKIYELKYLENNYDI